MEHQLPDIQIILHAINIYQGCNFKGYPPWLSNVIRHGCQMSSTMVVRVNVIHTIYNVFTDGFGILGEESEIFISHMHCSFGHQINFSLYHFCDCSVISERLDGVRG